MGGRAFITHDPPLPTPRMPLEIYTQVLTSALALLRQHYTYVSSPIPAPGKSDYGDVDFLVCSPLLTPYDLSVKLPHTVASNLSTLLGAKAFNVESGNPTVNLAVPWPLQSPSDHDGVEKYVQIDIHTCPSPAIFNWELFHSAHGDLWNILGSTIRPFGFTVNDRGLFLRIPEIEPHDRKKSLIFLTDEPSQVLDLLGLDETRWWTQFGSQDEMFEYAASCRFFWVKEKTGEEESGLEGDVMVESTIGAQEGGEMGKKKLKHNDRQRVSKRPIFAAWIEEYIPKCRGEGRFGNNTITRESIREEIFGKYTVREEYESKLKDWMLVRHKDELWREIIKGSVPVEGVDPAFRAAAIRQFKAVVMEQDFWNGKVLGIAVPNEEGFYDLDAVKKFVVENWRKVGEVGVIRTQERATESMRIKAEKKRMAKSAVA